MLLAAGAAPYRQIQKAGSPYNGKRPIEIAVEKGFLKVVETLLSAVNIDLGAPGENSPTPLEVARQKGYTYIVKALESAESYKNGGAGAEFELSSTPCIYDSSYKMKTTAQRRQFFKDLGITYMEENTFTPSCEPLSRLNLQRSEYDTDLTNQYSSYLKEHYVAPCSPEKKLVLGIST